MEIKKDLRNGLLTILSIFFMLSMYFLAIFKAHPVWFVILIVGAMALMFIFSGAKASPVIGA